MALRTAPARSASPEPVADERADALWEMERRLRRRGFATIAGADEAGRGACAGPLVAAACILPPGRRGRVPELADSKLLTAAARERVYAEVVDRAVSWSVVVIPVDELDARGMHVTNLEALRRAVCLLDPGPDYVLTDGFPVPGLERRRPARGRRRCRRRRRCGTRAPGRPRAPGHGHPACAGWP